MESVREPRGGLRLRAAYVPSTCRLRAVYEGWQTGTHIEHMPMLKLGSHVLYQNHWKIAFVVVMGLPLEEKRMGPTILIQSMSSS